MKMKASIISSDANSSDLAYLKYLLLSLSSTLTFQRSTTIERMKQRTYEKYREGYHLKCHGEEEVPE
ncbi:hypothetical protein C161_23534 [Paenibacillus sp. FSL R5-192]|uniref:hypothetical protein n=1 Tax=unclassified Paenibacillus TaxID=185978 RepID=UPI0003E1EE1E|nr:hypothetical protein [Paenibacillus sp. FSL R5-192]ETT32462.1 hypothetical protein C161_23534 [Paenibacillus sp. FSL R5-192]